MLEVGAAQKRWHGRRAELGRANARLEDPQAQSWS